MLQARPHAPHPRDACCHGRPRRLSGTDITRNQLHRRPGLISDLHQVRELVTHDLLRADPAVQHGLINDDPQRGRIGTLEDRLAVHAPGHELVQIGHARQPASGGRAVSPRAPSATSAPKAAPGYRWPAHAPRRCRSPRLFLRRTHHRRRPRPGGSVACQVQGRRQAARPRPGRPGPVISITRPALPRALLCLAPEYGAAR